MMVRLGRTLLRLVGWYVAQGETANHRVQPRPLDALSLHQGQSRTRLPQSLSIDTSKTIVSLSHQPESKRRKTPEGDSPSKVTTPISRGRLKPNKFDPDGFLAAPRERKKLWGEGDGRIQLPPASAPRAGHHNNHTRGMASGPARLRAIKEMVIELAKQPVTHPIIQYQLITEAQGIYSGGTARSAKTTTPLTIFPLTLFLSGDIVLDRDPPSGKYPVLQCRTLRAPWAIHKAKIGPPRMGPARHWRNAQAFTREIDRREWDRQGQAEAEISKLPESEQPDRRAAEEKERQDYEVWRAQHIGKASIQGSSPGTGPSPTSSGGDTSTASELPERTPGPVSPGASADSIGSRPSRASPRLNIGFFARVQRRLQNTKHRPRQRNPPRKPQEPGHNGSGTPLSTSNRAPAAPAATQSSPTSSPA
ncbi:hypothetical protein GGTG_13007 [Gaeumannomyces tritici R3-111a-1]|uniref:Uncharacterized protein n=1 Tax=Gaeumannomyces tritici (strain R3-111a-1) TaxID=644352 RepID=J3PHM7_GAET3|nr:hypothetical protein GGTG_13007 [Gaeumannomyces tritici R3-111a-1]EJT69388.1 hypothetical protein GGTG_13007 [Gaeumannomyces tritici R3-111a-1]